MSTFTITPSVTSLNEGDSVTYNVTGTPGVLPDGTIIYWSLFDGTVVPEDFDPPVLEGYATVIGGKIVITLHPKADGELSANKTVSIGLSLTEGGDIIAISNTVKIEDLIPTATIAADDYSVQEGDLITFNVTTTNVSDGCSLFFGKVSGTALADNFLPKTLSGSVEITNNTGSFTLLPAMDGLMLGDKTLAIGLFTNETDSSAIAVTDTITITDSPPATFSITPANSTVVEGNDIVFNIVTTNLSDGVEIPWDRSSGSATIDDFVPGVLTGWVTVSSNAATLTLTTKENDPYEGEQTIAIKLLSHDMLNTVATSSTVTITDASPTYSIVPVDTTVVEGDTIVFNITTYNLVDDTVIYWRKFFGTATESDFDPASLSGSVTIQSGAAVVNLVTITGDGTEGNETIALGLSLTDGGDFIANSSSVTISENI